jgi:hypothetical protein
MILSALARVSSVIGKAFRVNVGNRSDAYSPGSGPRATDLARMGGGKLFCPNGNNAQRL